jgi:hypothetical protein
MIDATLEIRRLNDSFRRGGGKRLMTAGIALPPQDQAAILAKVIAVDAFTEDNDPHGEHDFGAFDHAGHRIFWKIDYYDQSLDFGSEDPADPPNHGLDAEAPGVAAEGFRVDGVTRSLDLHERPDRSPQTPPRCAQRRLALVAWFRTPVRVFGKRVVSSRIAGAAT